MKSQGQSKISILTTMLVKAERLDVQESEYIAYQSGQPSKEELYELLKVRFPKRDYEIIEQVNGRTIKRV